MAATFPFPIAMPITTLGVEGEEEEEEEEEQEQEEQEALPSALPFAAAADVSVLRHPFPAAETRPRHS